MKLKQEYENWMETGELPENGLCSCLLRTKYKSTLELFEPLLEESMELSKEGISQCYWASGLSYTDNGRFYSFTPLRQTIVLLILAIHDEL